MQYPRCNHPDYILFGKNRGAQRYRCQAWHRTFQTMCRGKNPTLQEQARKLYFKGRGLRAIGRILGVHYKTVSRWLVLAAGQYPVNQTRTKACSFIEIDEVCSFVARKKFYAVSGQHWIRLLAKCLALSVVVDRPRQLESFSSY